MSAFDAAPRDVPFLGESSRAPATPVATHRNVSTTELELLEQGIAVRHDKAGVRHARLMEKIGHIL
jgi:hypothetical protein